MTKEKKRIGRPRSEAARRSIIAATLRLLENNSIRDLTIEAIAIDSGISKTTIYRWWNSKVSLVIDAFAESHLNQTPVDLEGDPVLALIKHWRLLALRYRQQPGRIVAQLVAEGHSDPDVLREFNERFRKGRQQAVADLIERLRVEYATGDLDLLAEILYSPIQSRLMLGMQFDDEFIETFPLRVLDLFGLRPPK